MPRIHREVVPGQIYHVINRGNNKAEVFHKPDDYWSFVELISKAGQVANVRLFCYCLMPNHFHLLVSPESEHALSQWMQWLMTSHVRRYHSHYGSLGHVWQGRFKSFLVKNDVHLLTVARYIEANPLRAGLATAAAGWKWSSYGETINIRPRHLTAPLPIEIPQPWGEYLNTPLTLSELAKLRTSVVRQAPFGDQDWQSRISKELHLENTLRPRGRPRKRGQATFL